MSTRVSTIVAALGTLILAVSCTTPSQRGVNTLPISPTVTRESAKRVAMQEIHRRRVPLPVGYQTKVSESFISQEAGPTIPVYTVSVSAGGRSLGRDVKRMDIYQVGISRSTGEVYYFFDLLKVTPSEIYAR